MAIQDDFTIDVVDLKVTYIGGFTNGIPDTIYTVNQLFSFLMDTADEPSWMQNLDPMDAATPIQYTLLNRWFIDDESMKALYGGAIQSSGWAYAASNGITQLFWTTGSSDAPITADIGKSLIVGATAKTGVILAVDAARRIVWVRNNGATQFVAGDNVVEDGGATVDFIIEADAGAQQGVRSGESVWANLFSVGVIQADTELYIAQEDETHGGSETPILTKIASWWDSDVDYTASPNGVTAGHIDVLVKVQDAGVWIDDLNLTNQGRLFMYARKGGAVYWHAELNASNGNFPVAFASTGADGNQDGFARMSTGTWTGVFTVGEVITGSTAGKAIVTAAVLDASIDYILLDKDQAEFGDVDVVTGEDSGGFATRVTGAAVAINGAVAGGITVTVGHDGTFDIDDDGNNEDFAIVVDANSLTLQTVYQRLMFLIWRGETAGILPEPGAGLEDGEFYRGIGDAYITTDAEGTALTEGETVTGSISNATGELVAYDFGGGVGYLIVTNVKGSFANNDVITDEGSGSVTASDDQENLVDVSAAPFGTFAGGRFFVARGVVLQNVLAADNNNWETSDVTGAKLQPPTTINLKFAGLVVNDRAAILEVGSLGGTDVVKTVGLASGAVGASLIVLDSAAEQDVPTTGWIRRLEVAVPGLEQRYEYSAITAAGVNVDLRVVSPGDDVADAGGSATVLSDINVGLNFGQDGQAKVGHVIRNVTDSSEAVILRRIDDDNIETTPLTGGTSDDWITGDAYEINTIQFLIDASDTAYFPYIDDTVESGTELSKALKFAGNTPIIARMRFSSPDVGGQRIKPFELKGQQITNADLTLTAIRNDDDIAA